MLQGTAHLPDSLLRLLLLKGLLGIWHRQFSAKHRPQNIHKLKDERVRNELRCELRNNAGRAVAQVVSRRRPTAAARVRGRAK
jgi:hypothetical protein